MLFLVWDFVFRSEFLNHILGQKMNAVGAILAKEIELISAQNILKRRYTIHNI